MSNRTVKDCLNKKTFKKAKVSSSVKEMMANEFAYYIQDLLDSLSNGGRFSVKKAERFFLSRLKALETGKTDHLY